MTELSTIPHAGGYAAGRQKESLPLLALLTFPFIVGAVSVSPLEGWNIIVKGMGVVLAVAFVIRSMTTNIRVSAEFFLYLAWIIWGLTGFAVSRYPKVVTGTILTLSQILIMTFIVMGATYHRRALTLNLLAVLAGVFIVGFHSFVTGEYSKPEDPGGRVAGIALNANAFGFLMVMGTIVLMYLWMIPHRHPWLWHIVLMVAMALAAAGTILSGSRAAILSMVVLYLCWGFFCYRADMFRRPKVLGAVVVAVLVCMAMFSSLYVGSLAEKRFGSAVKFMQAGGSGDGSVGTRWQMYKDGWEIIQKNPIAGVGLENFIFNASQRYVAHSEYLEVISDTGIVGGIIYFSIFVVLWIRAGKIAKYTRDITQFRIARLVRAVLIVIMISNFSRWYFYDKLAWTIFACFIGYTTAVWSEIREQQASDLAQNAQSDSR